MLAVVTVLLAYEKGGLHVTQNYLSWECSSLVDQPLHKREDGSSCLYASYPGVNLKSNWIAPHHIIGLSQTHQVTNQVLDIVQ